MDEQLLQRTRYQLQTRFRRVRNARLGHFEIICQQLFVWLENHPILSSIIQKLETVVGDHYKEIEMMLELEEKYFRAYYFKITGNDSNENIADFKGYTATNFEQHASACLYILRASITRPSLGFYCVLASYMTYELYGIRGHDEKESFDVLQNIALRDLYEYLDEHLDGINAVNGLMNKYKQSAEWFESEKLRDIVANGYSGKTGERALARHLQEYIFNHGMEFMIEPSSSSGQADLVLRDATGKYIIIDAKYIKEDSNRSTIVKKIAEGFNQVARYCNDYNQPEGFLAVFVNDDISIEIELEFANGFSYFKVGSRVIYFIEINVANRESASKSGKAKIMKEIKANELAEEIQELNE